MIVKNLIYDYAIYIAIITIIFEIIVDDMFPEAY